MELNQQAIQTVINSPRLLNLILTKKPLSKMMWSLDDITEAQVLHVQEVYKSNMKLVEPYLPIPNSQIEKKLPSGDRTSEFNEIISIHRKFYESVKGNDLTFCEQYYNEILDKVKILTDKDEINYFNSNEVHLKKIMENLYSLNNPEISLQSKLLNNEFATRASFWVVPGQSDKKCIILLQADMHSNDQLEEMISFFSKEGLGGSFIISEWTHIGVLSSYLIKTRNVSAYLQDIGLHHISDVHESLGKGWLNEDDKKFMKSLPLNWEGDDINWAYRKEGFTEKMKPVTLILK